MSRMNQNNQGVTALTDSDEVDALIGGRGPFGSCPPKGQLLGANIYFFSHPPKKTKPGSLDPLEPLTEVDFLSGFGAPLDESWKHLGSIRAL